MKTSPVASLFLAAGFVLCMSGTSASGQDIRLPVGISNQHPIYYPNSTANPVTFEKQGWYTDRTLRPPLFGMWQNQEHAIFRSGPNRWTVIAMETNRNFFAWPGGNICDAYMFLEYDDDVLEGPVSPVRTGGYWRGATLTSHAWVWAPYVYHEAGVYYLFFTAPYPATGRLACYLATSTTGSATPSEWVEYDPDPHTPEIEPLFKGIEGVDVKDFHVIRVPASPTPQYYCYYIATPWDGEIGLQISEMRVRTSPNLYSWPDSGEAAQPAFRRINVGETASDRYFVDYENPEVIRRDDGLFYLFISRHGQLPADYTTNPNWTPIPLATEVYWSTDGLTFPADQQLPNLRQHDGREINAAEIISDGNRWFATHASPSNNLNYYEFDAPPGAPVPYEHSEIYKRIIGGFLDAENSLQLIEFEWQSPAKIHLWFVY